MADYGMLWHYGEHLHRKAMVLATAPGMERTIENGHENQVMDRCIIRHDNL